MKYEKYIDKDMNKWVYSLRRYTREEIENNISLEDCFIKCQCGEKLNMHHLYPDNMCIYCEIDVPKAAIINDYFDVDELVERRNHLVDKEFSECGPLTEDEKKELESIRLELDIQEHISMKCHLDFLAELYGSLQDE